MGNVYRHDSHLLHELLDKASASNGATLLIPDLQRPFVWTPNQVTLLIDSLIRGWPFGTLLLWKVNHQELQGIPFRPFWSVVDRTDNAEGAQVGQMNPPAEYHMVLDGQQRVQSLLLALGGDDWGFKLDDRDWTEEIKEQRPRGRRSKYPHWSKASLCFDLQMFMAEYERKGNNLLAVDFRKVLLWAITDPQNGQSNFPKPSNYEDPLPKLNAPGNQEHLIRLSRLWNEAPANPGLKEAQFRQILKPVLEQHSIAPGMIEKLLPPLGELMTTLRDVKLADVTYLELQPFDSSIWTLDSYNDAIVSIFTRLNTAGRTLTREEITLAWLKVGWEPALTDGKSAGDCFTELGSAIGEYGLVFELDGLVSAASFLWSVSNNEGRLLANSDLLKGDVTRPMASALSRRWKAIQRALDAGSRVLFQRGLEYGSSGHFSSLYALAVFWAWLYTAEIWKTDHQLTELQRDNFEKLCNKSANKYIDRWIFCSQWAGVWSGSSITTIEAYSKRLTEMLKSIGECANLSEAHKVWDECFETIVESLTPKATEIVTSISASGRERVAIYRNPLWVWHRLDTDRWEKSQIQMRLGRRKATCEVDHIVSFSLWKDKLDAGLPNGISDEDEALSLANKLGNCALLEKNFNISKSKQSLKSFLSQIHEFIHKTVRLDSWCAALAIPKPLLDPDLASVDAIREAVDRRDEEIKGELSEFVRGYLVRADVDTPPIEKPVSEGNQQIVGQETGSIDNVAEEVHEQADEEHETSSESEIKIHDGVDVTGLRSAYVEDDSMRLVIDHFASRQRNQKITEVDTLVDALHRSGTSLARHTVVKVFRSLDALGVGRFIPGRKGHATRFEWYEKSLSVRESLGPEIPDGSVING